MPAQFYSNASPHSDGAVVVTAVFWLPVYWLNGWTLAAIPLHRAVPWPCSSLFLRALVRTAASAAGSGQTEHPCELILVR